jgi:hypothetical protein
MSSEGAVSGSDHLRAMVELAGTFFTESLNRSNPIMPADRTLHPDDFLTDYMAHSNALCAIITQHTGHTQPPEVDEELDRVLDKELEQGRGVLKKQLAVLEEKLAKLNTLRFWMDNMLHGRPPPAQAQGGH